MAGLGGLAFVGQGYDESGLQQLQRRQAELQFAGMQAFGRAFQQPQGATPGVLPAPGPTTPVGPPTSYPGAVSVQPGPAPDPSMYGPTTGQLSGGFPSRPGANNAQVFRPPVAPQPMQPGPMFGGPQMGPPTTSFAGAPGGAAPPGAGPQAPAGTNVPQGSFDPTNAPLHPQLMQMAQRIAQANPGAPPEVIAAAMNMAMPLMQADAQMQWKILSVQLATDRAQIARDRLTETESYHGSLTKLREDAAAETKRHHEETENTARQNAQTRLDEARDRFMDRSFKRTGVERDRLAKELKDRFNELDKIERARIAAASQLSGADKKAELARLDQVRADYFAQIDAMKEQLNRGEQPGFTPGQVPGGQTKPMSQQTPAPGRGTATDFNQTFGDAGMRKPLPPDELKKGQDYIKANPGKREGIIQYLQSQGFNTEGL